MKNKKQLNRRLAQLDWFRTVRLTPEIIGEIRSAIGDTNNLIVSRAAETASMCDLEELSDDLLKAYDYFSNDPLKRDKGCLAKTAIVKSLSLLDFDEADIFLRGIKQKQMEPVYGGKADTAGDLRGNCAVALARIGYPDVFYELTNLLVDNELQARLAAVEAIGALGGEQGELLLRLKCLTGDSEPRVLDSCFIGLMAINPYRSIPFLAQFLASADLIIVEAAALALGESQEAGAFECLYHHWLDEPEDEIKNLLLLPISLTRQEKAFEFLVALIADGKGPSALSALKSLEIYKHDPQLNQRIETAVQSRKDAEFRDLYLQIFTDE